MQFICQLRRKKEKERSLYLLKVVFFKAGGYFPLELLGKGIRLISLYDTQSVIWLCSEA